MSSPSFDSFAEPQQGQLSGAGITTRSRGRCSGNGLRDGRLRWKDCTVCVRAAACSAASSSSVAVASSSSSCKLHLLQQPRLVLRASAVKLPPQLLDLQLEMSDQRFRARRSPPAREPQAASASKRAARSARIIACAAARSDGSDSNCDVTQRQNHIRQQLQSKNRHPTDVGRHVSCGCLQSMPDSR